jgi:hypothetical protein
MMGIAIAMAVLLIGGFSLVTKFVQSQAQSSPKFIATELTTLINTVQAAPETVTFDYYTEIKQDGYPVIGSLEIDDNKKELCVGPKTEGEIFGSIVDQAAIGAGFGAIGFAQNRVRSAVAQRATQKAIASEMRFGGFTKLGLSKQMIYKVGVGNSKESQLARKFLLLKGDAELSDAESKAFVKAYTYTQRTELYNARGKLTPDMERAIVAVGRNEEIKAEGILARAETKIPGTLARKESQYGQEAEAYFAQKGENPSLYGRTGGKIVKVGKAGSIGGGGLVIAGVFATASYFLTGGDWNAVILTFAQATIMNYAPKIMEKFLSKYVADAVEKAIAAAAASEVEADLGDGAGEVAEKTPPPANIPFWAAYGAAKLAETITNVAFSVYNAVALDLTFLQIHNAASHQVAIERSSIACEKFVAPKNVLLTPPNCMPEVKYGSTFENYRGLNIALFLTTSIASWEATGWAVATAYPPSATKIPTRKIYLATALGVTPAYASLAYTIAKDPTGIVPRPGCSSSCDTTYMRQDCPNWFLSTPGLSGAGTQVAGWSFATLLNAGPLCAGLSLTGTAGVLCHVSRITTAITVFLTAPSEVYNFFLQGDQVGLKKTVIKSKTAPEFPDLTGEFADNTGYWYAEFPYVIELNKVYMDDSSSAKRNPPLIIRKV